MVMAEAPSLSEEQALLALLLRHEGLRLRPYQDTAAKLTIGVGRNLDDVGISRPEVLFLLSNDIRRVEVGLDADLPWWRGLDPVRQRVLVDMAFNLGIKGLLGFEQMLRMLHQGRVIETATEMLSSLWAGQVGHRAVELAAMMRSGVDAPLSSTP